MKVLIGGIVALLFGLWGLIGWWSEFVGILQGTIPFILLVGGSIATYAGIASAKDRAAKKREEEIKEIEKRVEKLEKEKEKKEKKK
ncbi:MAG: hypothetical protein DDT42_01262 [candidate division WS2 bacterium]|uniref:Uncharacterized protein n=1 Tax=Psychracetigena formicireducens TaxID=2986056 RepID=A0A9E2F4S6_PSYF1|nr:hypothetical protein [Candidatus Psychracetigena formicireducens]